MRTRPSEFGGAFVDVNVKTGVFMMGNGDADRTGNPAQPAVPVPNGTYPGSSAM
jgi:hypothetical protein